MGQILMFNYFMHVCVYRDGITVLEIGCTANVSIEGI